MILLLGKNKIEMGDWVQVSYETNNRMRIIEGTSSPFEQRCGPLLMVSWVGHSINNNIFHWDIHFLGPQLSCISDACKEIKHPLFMDKEYEAAQNYVDELMVKISKLKAFW